LARIKAIGARAVILPRRNRLHQHPYSKNPYRRRNQIERWFCRIKHFRRIATATTTSAERFVSFICLAATLRWIARKSIDPGAGCRGAPAINGDLG
jgi:transposase